MRYGKNFFEGHKDGSLSSAKGVVPQIMKLLQPKKVVDVGCGIGTWLSVFREEGVDEVLGIDGNWLDKEMLLVPKEYFQNANLEKPLEIGEKFDLVVSLEVAEHLPQNCAENFIDSLIQLGPAILFSAAIPHQGGTHHQNEQWPDYWQKKFEERGYLFIDCIRKKIWDSDKVAWWYAQNIFLAVKKELLDSNEMLKKEFLDNRGNALSLVHPRNYLSKFGFKSALINIIPHRAARTVKKYFVWFQK